MEHHKEGPPKIDPESPVGKAEQSVIALRGLISGLNKNPGNEIHFLEGRFPGKK